MWNNTRITQLLGIEYPLLLGPMGGGFSTPAFTAAISNAGGLGSYGAYTMTPEQIIQAGHEIKQLTGKPFNINLWVSDVDEQLAHYPAERIAAVQALFQPYFDELGVGMPQLTTNIPSKFEKQAEAILTIQPAVFSFIFGAPSPAILQECKRRHIITVGAATTQEEAVLLEEAGVDAIVAAGFEAGGHRPSFLRPADDSLTGLLPLVAQLKAVVKVPVIAAGGIGDGKGIAAALTLGADAVQLGTAFLASDESAASPLHKATLQTPAATHTVLSKSLTGRMGRMIHNRIAAEVSYATEVLPFPLHNRFLAPLKEAAIAQGRTDLVNLWAGQNTTNIKTGSAATIMQELIKEASVILEKNK